MKTLTAIFGGFTGNSLTAMKLMDDIRHQTLWNEDLISLSIRRAAKPDIQIIRDIQDFITDNRKMVESVMGIKLVQRVIDFK